MTWLLDTNVLVHIGRGQPRAVVARYRATLPGETAVSSVTVAELWYGVARDADPEVRRAKWETVLLPLRVVDFDRAAAEVHGRLRHELRHAPIGDRDLYIAATAVAHGYTVVTANVREFARVPGLAVEDWTAA